MGKNKTGYPAPVPQTGQTKCYDQNDEEEPCQDTGQDGDHRAGVTWPEPRFKDNRNGTVTDRLTGLIWLKNANCGNNKVNWETAFAWVDELNKDGIMNNRDAGDSSKGGTHQRDWRLPNVRELQSLIDYGQPQPNSSEPALPADHPFTGVQWDGYWSSSTHSDDTTYGWYVNLNNGYVSHDVKTYPSFYVWPVRGGQ